ncbi:MAG: zinc-binding dehydrogenase, partial [Pseudomonadota bacterium]
IVLVKNLAILGLYWGAYRRRAPELLAAEFAQLFAWYERDLLRPHVSHALDLSRAAEALTLLRERKATGKIVLTVDGD